MFINYKLREVIVMIIFTLQVATIASIILSMSFYYHGIKGNFQA